MRTLLFPSGSSATPPPARAPARVTVPPVKHAPVGAVGEGLSLDPEGNKRVLIQPRSFEKNTLNATFLDF